MKNFAKNILSFLLIFAVFCIASCSGLSDVEAPEIAAESGTTNISTGGGTNGNAPTVVPIVDGTLSVAIELGLSANKTAARSAAPSGLDEDFVYAATIFHSASYESLKICEYNYDSATNKATLKIPFALSEAARENHVLNICAFPAETDLDSFASVADAILNSVLHGTTTISTAANSISATLGDSVVKLFPKSGNGTVELKITLPSADYTLSCSDETNFAITGTSPNYVLKNAGSGIASGSYPVTLKVSKDSNVVYTRNETINVFPAMKSDVWLSGDGTSSSNATLSISVSEIDSTLYVCGSGSTWFLDFGSSIAGDDDNGDGSIGKPYATIQKAIEKIKATTTAAADSFTIYVDGTVKASGSTPVADFSEIQSGCSIAIKGLDATNKATLDGKGTAQGIKAGTFGGTTANLNLTLENLLVRNGSGTYGGGILLVTTTGNIHTISNCEISGNTATYGSGILNSGIVTMSGGTISGNTATQHGGGIFNSGTFTMSGGEISGNTASDRGGGIYNSAAGTFTLSGREISGNSAANGGGVYNSGTVTMSGGTISGNTTTSSGGGIYNNGPLEFSGAATVNSNNDVYLYTDNFITITDSLTATGTVATITPETYTSRTKVLQAANAGLITDNYSKFVLANSNYAIAQHPTTTTTAVIVDNTPRALVYLDATSGSDLNDGSTKAKAVKTLKRATDLLLYTAANPKIIVVSTYTLPGTETGLLDFSTKSNTVTLERYYSSNPAEHCSGHMLKISSGTVAIKNVTFDGNWKANGGTGSEQLANAAGVLLSVSGSGTDVTLGEGCTIKNNSNSSHGGGIYNNSGTLKLDGATISGNSAGETFYGGGIYNYMGTFTMSGGTIGNASASNVASASECSNKAAAGGGIFNDNGTVTLSGGNISYNYAKSGGCIYNLGTLTLDGATISGNSAIEGGGIFNDGGKIVTMSGGEISGNTATTNGGGIHNIGILNFSGAASVNSNNDVYLRSEKFITITGDLTGTAPVAKITPNSYTSGRVVLKAATTALITDNYSKFALSDASTYSICPDSATPTQAILAKPSAGLDIGLLGSDFVFTPKINGAAASAGQTLAAGGEYVLTFTLTPTSVTGTTFTDYKIAVRQHNTTDDLSTLTAHGSTLSAATTTITAALSNAFKQVEAIDIYMEVTVKINDNGLEYSFDRTVEGFTFE